MATEIEKVTKLRPAPVVNFDPSKFATHSPAEDKRMQSRQERARRLATARQAADDQIRNVRNWAEEAIEEIEFKLAEYSAAVMAEG